MLGEGNANTNTSKLKVIEKANTIAIYCSIVILFIILIFSSLPQSTPPFLQITGAQILIIVIIAALLLFRYYNTVKIGTLLELTNAEQDMEREAQNNEKEKDNIGDSIKNVSSLIDQINELIKKTDASKSTVQNYVDTIKNTKNEMVSGLTTGNQKERELSSIQSGTDVITYFSPKIDTITNILEEIPGAIDTPSKQELMRLKTMLENEKARLQRIDADLQESIQTINRRRARLASVREEYLRR